MKVCYCMFACDIFMGTVRARRFCVKGKHLFYLFIYLNDLISLFISLEPLEFIHKPCYIPCRAADVLSNCWKMVSLCVTTDDTSSQTVID